MGLFSFFGTQNTSNEQSDSLAAFGLSEQDVASQEQQSQIPWHCGWCQPYVNGATTGICAACEEANFPKKRR